MPYPVASTTSYPRLMGVSTASNAAWTPSNPLPSGGTTPGIWTKSNVGLYKDAAKAQPATADGDAIYTWANISSNNDFIQSVLGNRALLKIVSGVPYVRFDGVDDSMVNTISADSTQTLFFIAKKTTSVTGAAKTLASITGDNCQIFTQTTIGTGWNYYSQSVPVAIAGGGTPTSLSIICVVFTSLSSASLFINSNSGISFDPHDDYSTGTNFTIGGRAGGGVNGDYDFLEILQYTTTLNTIDRTQVMTYLTTRVANPT